MAEEHECLQCQQKFLQPSQLRRHMETHMITGDFLCGLCNCLCNRLPTLDDHWRKACPEFRILFDDEEIKTMSYEDLRETAFRLTLDRYSIEDNCQEPGPSTESKKSKPSICIYCNLHLPSGTLSNHYGVHSNRNSPGELCQNSVVRYICDLCGFGFRFKKSLYAHWRQKCAEISANCPPQGIVLNNRELKKMVQGLVKRAEVEKPHELLYNRGEEEEVDDEDEDDEETKLSFTSRIVPIEGIDYKNWNVENVSDHSKCPDCGRKFHSIERLNRHIEVYHGEEKNSVFCELCQMKFTQRRILLRHLRNSCKAVRVEEPDDKKRLKLSIKDLDKMIENVKPRWKSLFNKKKRKT
uniref:C2H2-type domain-containing protein n=1 Tax=Caenorhabditis tropicalis TaxID=1561998 RepID=A0A1I7TYN7_9PELO